MPKSLKKNYKKSQRRNYKKNTFKKSLKRKSLKRKSLKRTSLKRKSMRGGMFRALQDYFWGPTKVEEVDDGTEGGHVDSDTVAQSRPNLSLEKMMSNSEAGEPGPATRAGQRKLEEDTYPLVRTPPWKKRRVEVNDGLKRHEENKMRTFFKGTKTDLK